MSRTTRIAVIASAAATLGVIAGAGVSAVALSGESENTTATVELAAVPATCENEIGPFSGMAAIMETLAGNDGPGTAVNVCDSYQRGSEVLPILRSLPVQWDAQCLNAAGWDLAATGQPTARNGSNHPQNVAHCATPVPTAEQCESLRQGLQPGAWLELPHATALSRLGCTNTELRPIQ